MTKAIVIGGGPAGLMAAETLAELGVSVTLADRMPSVGRKFLMAGKSGLNLTKAEPPDAFWARYGSDDEQLAGAIAGFGPERVQDWARGLGQDIFTGSTGRVFPKDMKASPILRAWLRRLGALGVKINTRWNWTGWDGQGVTFDTPVGTKVISADITILAVGGASWARLGSDGTWSAHFDRTVPFQPANMGFLRKWSRYMEPYFGHPIKGVTLRAGELVSRGEFVLSASGFEGGGIYEVSRAMRDGAPLEIDLVPDIDEAALNARWSERRAKATLDRFLRAGLRLSPVKRALLNEVLHASPANDTSDMLRRIKALPISHDGPGPIDQAISTGGGIPFADLNEGFMYSKRPGVFCAGEMLDWEAPTGGYLITACLATGRAAASAAVEWHRHRIL